MKEIVIIGAGQACGAAIIALRQSGFEGKITILGEEAHPPYERPPLSKSVLSGAADIRSTYMVSAEELASDQTTFLPNQCVTLIRRDQKMVETADGLLYPYDRLIIATGGRVRRLDLPNVAPDKISYLRSIEDSVKLQKMLAPGRKLLVIGGGWIGLEAAATARQLDVEVALVETADRLCARAASPLLSAYLLGLHGQHEVDVRLSTGFVSAEQTSEGIDVVLTNGERLTVDHILIGVGLIPNSELAEAAGLKVDNGIVTSPEGETDDPDIFACGDVANFHHRSLGKKMRLESWENANCQADAMVGRIMGEPSIYSQTPWFWSDQYGVNIQILGTQSDGEPVIRGDIDNGPVSLFHLTPDNRLQSVTTINNAKEMAIAKRLMERNIVLTPEALQSAPKLKALL